MSVWITVELEKSSPTIHRQAIGRGNYGQMIATFGDQLDRLARKKKVTPLGKFTALDPDIVDEFVELGKSLGEKLDASKYAAGWFDPAEGFKTAKTLLATFQANPKSLGKLGHYQPEEIIYDLDLLTKVLKLAAERKVRFRLIAA